MNRLRHAIAITLAAVLADGGVAMSAPALAWVEVGDPGVAADPATGSGAVPVAYRIGETEVSNEQYAEFLNAVASSDPHGLYSLEMSGAFGGIIRGGTAGSFSYAVVAGREALPVNFVSWHDAVRFANWAHHGQPTGVGATASTESGAYDLAGGGARSAGARVFLPTVDEWHKAAFHQPAASGGDVDGYWLYPTGSNAAPSSDRPNDIDAPDPTQVANYFANDGLNNGYDEGYAVGGSSVLPADATQALSPVGAYPLAQTHYGALDMSGNVWEWGETALGPGSARAYYGGAWDSTAFALASTSQFFGDAPEAELSTVGFRLAALAVAAGDYNSDGLVDAADYTRWRDTEGSSSTLDADGDGSGLIDTDDYSVWASTYGESCSCVASAVPEPIALSVASLAGLARIGTARRRRYG